MYNIAIDFGTTNTLIGIYDIDKKQIEVLDFLEISQKMGKYSAIPSKIGYLNKKRFLIGNKIRNNKLPQRNIFDKMKLYFNKYKSRPIEIDLIKIDHKKAAFDFLSLLFDLIFIKYPQTKINKFILTAPVDSFDLYRVFLAETCEEKNIYNYQILDEPTAVALGYNAVVSPDYPYMIIDFGGGTLDMSIVRLNNAQKANEVNVLGKSGANLGGIYIDNWLMQDFLNKEKLELNDISHFKTELSEKIEELKINITNHGKAEFTIEDKKNDFEMKYQLNREELDQILKNNYFVQTIQECIDNAIDSAYETGVKKREIKKVFMVGGSSLLPLFQEILINNFNDKLISSEPFSAVIKGACNFISGTIIEDFLHHNYSLQHYNKDRGIYDYEIIVPEKTKFPVNNIKQLIIATPFSGQEEIELKFFEILTNIYNEESIEDINFDESGNLIVIKDNYEIEKSRKIVPLNTNNDCFIKLNPLSIKSEERIKLKFHVNENRILSVDAIDLKTNKVYYKGYEIARLK